MLTTKWLNAAMMHKLSPLPFSIDALEPFLSRETVEIHYEKHHRGYLDKLNSLIPETSFEPLTLKDIIVRSRGQTYTAIFNSAAQVWNHDFYWKSLAPKASTSISKSFESLIQKSFGSVGELQSRFCEDSIEHFGSGYTWMIINSAGKLEVLTTVNAENPLVEGLWPLVNCDLWEHSYYIDYRNKKSDYISEYWHYINWDFAESNFLDWKNQERKLADL